MPVKPDKRSRWKSLRKPREPEPVPETPVEDGAAAMEAPEPPPTAVLLAHTVTSTTRLIRETLEQFTSAQVFSTPDPLRAFELALQRRYALFIISIQVGDLSGPMLYELIAKAYASERGPRLVAPGVVFVREKDDPRLPDSLSGDVRVKALLTKPIRIERLLQCVSGVLEVRDPTTRS